MITSALRLALVGELGKFRVADARAFGDARDRKIAMLMSGHGPRRARATSLARWSVGRIYRLPEDADDELSEDYQAMLDVTARNAALAVERSAPTGFMGAQANEAQFLSASTTALKFVAVAAALAMMFVTEDDERVCKRCRAAEAGGPYPAQDAPEPPLHLVCRCILIPTG